LAQNLYSSIKPGRMTVEGESDYGRHLIIDKSISKDNTPLLKRTCCAVLTTYRHVSGHDLQCVHRARILGFATVKCIGAAISHLQMTAPPSHLSTAQCALLAGGPD
jgi:hypothetical protein